MLPIVKIKEICHPIECGIVDENGNIEHLSFDSRQVAAPATTLFFAISTAKNDGHRYIADLVEKGVRNFVVTKSLDCFAAFSSSNFFRVDNSVEAMQAIAAYHRRQFDYPVLGITGSNGKTTIKEWLGEMLSSDYNVVKNPNSYNSQIGVPLSVWQMGQRHNLAIFEAGISQSGEMEKLANIIAPNIGILTNIGTAHDEFFHHQKEKIIEKSQLFKNCSFIIYNSDNQEFDNYFKHEFSSKAQLWSWGKNKDAFMQVEILGKSNLCTQVKLRGELLEIPFTDAGSVENVLHSAVFMHLYLHFSWDKIQQKIRKLSPISMRMEMIEGIHNTVIVNDTYSLDMSSLRIALDFLNKQTQELRKTVVLSDFEQAGELEDADYQEINNLLLDKGITKFLAVGEGFYAHRDVFSFAEQHFFKTSEAFLCELRPSWFDHEIILVKGARSYRFEKVVAALQFKTHKTMLQVSLPALINNLDYYRSLLKPETKLVAMVKAQSYGLGDVELISELLYHHVDYLAVAYTDEGLRLRRRNIQCPIIVLGAEAHSFEAMIQYRLEPEIFNFHYLQELKKLLHLHPEISDFPIHIKLDTGMHRLGFDEQDLPALIQFIKETPQLRIASIFSHLAAAEDPSEDDFTRGQLSLFDRMSSQIVSAFNYRILRHILNSAGISRFPEAQYDMVRLGIGLYGFSGVADDQQHLQNTITLKTVVTQVKTVPRNESIGYNRSYRTYADSRIAIVPIGYADGFPRELGNGIGQVIIAGKRVPIVGKICMDMCMVDVTGLDVKEGDEVIIYGDDNRVDHIAERIHRIPYELLTSISKRVQRVYIKD